MCKLHPDLHKHAQALRQLGAAGMSSDESSIEDSPHLVYKILKQRWRAKAVTAWLREMDAVYLSMRITEG